MKEKWKKFNDLLPVSAPIQIYLALLFISSICIVAANYMSDGTIIDVSTLNLSQIPPDGIIKIPDGNTWDSIIANLGYGIFCSTIVAFLVDIGATNRQRENDKTEFTNETQGFRKSFSFLIQIRNIHDQLNKEEVTEDSLIDWYRLLIISCLLGNKSSNPKQYYYISLLVSFSSPIVMVAKDVRYKSAILADNQYMPDNFFTNLDFIIRFFETFPNDPNQIALFGFNIDSLFKTIVEMFPEYEDAFFEEWDSKRMIQKYGPDISNMITFYENNGLDIYSIQK